MSWLAHHKKSERLAGQAETAKRRGNDKQAKEFYKRAAESEANALNEVDEDKPRTYGITAVSAVALYLKAEEPQAATDLTDQCFSSGRLPGFAHRMLQDSIAEIKPEAGRNRPARNWLNMPECLPTTELTTLDNI